MPSGSLSLSLDTPRGCYVQASMELGPEDVPIVHTLNSGKFPHIYTNILVLVWTSMLMMGIMRQLLANKSTYICFQVLSQ